MRNTMSHSILVCLLVSCMNQCRREPTRESLYVSLHLLNAHKLEHWMLLCIRYAYLHSTKNQYKQLDAYIEFGMGLFSRNQRRFQKCTGHLIVITRSGRSHKEWEVTQRVGGHTKSGRSHKEWEVKQRPRIA